VFALAGKITNTGLIEVPMGTTLRKIVESHGRRRSGTAGRSKRYRRRPVGGCIPAEGAGYAGGLRFTDQARLDHGLGRHDRHGRTTQMVDVRGSSWSSAWMSRAANASPAGRAPVQMHNLLTKILARKATVRDLKKLEELCDMVKSTRPVRPGPDRTQPGAEHVAVLPEGIYGVAPGRTSTPGPTANGNGNGQKRRCLR